MMKKIIAVLYLVMVVLIARTQNGPQEAFQNEVNASAVPLKHTLIKNSYSPFKAKLSSFLTKISLTSTFSEGENARADLGYIPNKDSNVLVGLSVDQKIGNTGGQATPFSLAEGINAGTTVGFNLAYIHWKPKLSSAAFSNFNQSADAFAKRNNTDRRSVTYNDIRNNGTNEEKKLLPRLKNPVFFNLSVAFTKTSFSFATDSVTLEANDASYITPDINFSVGVLTSITGYLAIGYSYSGAYAAADDLSFTSPFGTSGNFINQTIAFGSPQKQTDSKISIQWSNIFGASSSIGIAPTFTLGLTSKMASLTLPVYFIKGTADGKPNGLQGGIQLGYLTATNTGSLTPFKDGFGAQLIIGVPFGVFTALE